MLQMLQSLYPATAMPSTSLFLRRTYATVKAGGVPVVSSGTSSSSTPARTLSARRASAKLNAIAQAKSAALKVKERREEMNNQISKSGVSSGPLRPDVKLDDRRSRLRGVKISKGKGGLLKYKVVGERIYLPNIIFTLVRNHTPPGQPYNPYEATFYVSQNITKTDIRSYLHTIYNVDVTYIRTDNYLVPENFRQRMRKQKVGRVYKKAYKRAVVGLVKPFYYPLAVEDMNGADRWTREQNLNELFKLDFAQKVRDYQMKMGLMDAWDWRPQRIGRIGILKRVYEEREKRERVVRELIKQHTSGASKKTKALVPAPEVKEEVKETP